MTAATFPIQTGDSWQGGLDGGVINQLLRGIHERLDAVWTTQDRDLITNPQIEAIFDPNQRTLLREIFPPHNLQDVDLYRQMQTHIETAALGFIDPAWFDRVWPDKQGFGLTFVIDRQQPPRWRRLYPREISDTTATGFNGQVARNLSDVANGVLYRYVLGDGWIPVFGLDYPDIIENEGQMEHGDIIGPWIFNEMHDALVAMEWVVEAIGGGAGFGNINLQRTDFFFGADAPLDLPYVVDEQARGDDSGWDNLPALITAVNNEFVDRLLEGGAQNEQAGSRTSNRLTSQNLLNGSAQVWQCRAVSRNVLNLERESRLYAVPQRPFNLDPGAGVDADFRYDAQGYRDAAGQLITQDRANLLESRVSQSADNTTWIVGPSARTPPPNWIQATTSDPPLDVLVLGHQLEPVFLHRHAFEFPPPVVGIPGDLNGDGFVGVDDLNIVLLNWNQTVPPGDPRADADGDGFVGLADLNIVLANWNRGTPPGG